MLNQLKKFILNSLTFVRFDGDAEVYYLFGLLKHREDGPAVIHKNNVKKWYKYGKLHRDDGHAYESGLYKIWHINGNIHRIDGPAVEFENGLGEWYVNDELIPYINCADMKQILKEEK